MTYEQIEEIVAKKHPEHATFQIRFRVRNPIRALFIRTPDFRELGKKNLWRIVSDANIALYQQSGDESLARIFNGAEFTKLERL